MVDSPMSASSGDFEQLFGKGIETSQGLRFRRVVLTLNLVLRIEINKENQGLSHFVYRNLFQAFERTIQKACR